MMSSMSNSNNKLGGGMMAKKNKNKNKNNKNNEISKDEAVQILLTDEDLSDLTLKSTIDGKSVLAHRVLLASRSRIFRTMLYGNYRESSSNVIDLQYPGSTIQAIVNYIYTGSIDIVADEEAEEEQRETSSDHQGERKNHRSVSRSTSLSSSSSSTCCSSSSSTRNSCTRSCCHQQKKKLSNNNNNNNNLSNIMILSCQQLVSIMDAATFFELGQLRQRCEYMAIEQISTQNNTAEALCVYYLAMCGQHPSLDGSELEQFCIDQISRSPDLLLEQHHNNNNNNTTNNNNINSIQGTNNDDDDDSSDDISGGDDDDNQNYNVFRIGLLSYSQLESILQDPDMLTDELTLFKILQAWSEEEEDDDDDGNNNEEEQQQQQQQQQASSLFEPVSPTASPPAVAPQLQERDTHGLPTALPSTSRRIEQARSLTQHINLTLIPPSKLTSIIAKSGLVTSQQLLDAFQMQALKAESHGTTFSALRCPVVWESTTTTTYSAQSMHHSVESLKCKVMTNGPGKIFKWTILVEETCDWSWLGVISTTHKVKKDSFLGNQAGGWVVSSDFGYTDHAARRTESGLRFRKGSRVTFILDLTKNGVLSAYVNGQTPATELFTDMCLEEFDEEEEHGASKSARFVPAVSLRRPGRVKFLGFE